MDKLIWTNNDEKCFEDLLKEYGEKADKIFIASAFFTETKLITEWTKSGKNVEILVRLMPPTSYDSLNEIYMNDKISIWFLGKSFHSKCYVFFNNENPYAIIIGSSNFTGGGLRNNIETNAILKESIYLNEIEKEITELKEISKPLNEQFIEEYRVIFNESEPIQKEYHKIRDLYSEIKSTRFNNLNWKRNNSISDNLVQEKPEILDRMEDIWVSYSKKLHEFANISSKQTPKEKYHFDVTFGINIGDIFIRNHCNIKENKVQLWVMIKQNPEEVFNFLYDKKNEIQHDVENKLFWNSKPKIKRLELEFDTDFKDMEKINDAINWLVLNTKIFHEKFRKYLIMLKSNNIVR